jgi:hypothetical protein
MKGIFITIIHVFLLMLYFISCDKPFAKTDKNTEGVSQDSLIENPSDNTDIHNWNLQLMAQRRISLLEEFFDRFNGVDTNIISTNRQSALASLFDKDYKNNIQLDSIKKFIQEVIENKSFLDFNDKDWFAVLTTKVNYRQMDTLLDLILKFQTNQDSTQKWVLVGAKSSFLPAITPKNNDFLIKPNAHNLDFYKVVESLNELKNQKKINSNYFKSENLKAFCQLLKKEELILLDIENIEFHFFQIPHWHFAVKQNNNLKQQSGWLIFKLNAINTADKLHF